MFNDIVYVFIQGRTQEQVQFMAYRWCTSTCLMDWWSRPATVPPRTLVRYLWIELTTKSRLGLWKKDQDGGEPKHHSREARSTSSLFYSKLLNQKKPNPHWLKERIKWDYFSTQIFHNLQYLWGQLRYPNSKSSGTLFRKEGGILDTVWDPEIIKPFWVENCKILGVLEAGILTNSGITKLLIKRAKNIISQTRLGKSFAKKSFSVFFSSFKINLETCVDASGVRMCTFELLPDEGFEI